MIEHQFNWRTLTAEVADKGSPLRQHLEARFPHLRPIQIEYKASAGRILVPPGRANAGTLGAAFDYTVRYALDPGYAADLAVVGFMFDGLQNLSSEVVSVAEAAQSFRPGSRELMRACWALALCTEVLRVGIMPGSPLSAMVAEERLTTSALLDLASREVVAELSDLHRVAEDHLLPHLRGKTPLKLGPTFAGSRQCPADADLIAAGTLIDLKCTVGKKNSAGDNYIALDRHVIHQLIAYALFDYVDEYEIDTVGLYSARFGHFARWPLTDLLGELAGQTISVREERAAVEQLLKRWA